LATAGVVALVLLFLTGPLQYLPRRVLGAIVFTIAVRLVDLRRFRGPLRARATVSRRIWGGRWEAGAARWRPTAAVPGTLSGPGLVVFQFGANLFYANAGRFAEDVRSLIERAPTPVNWLVVDAGAITNVDYSAARVLRDLHEDLTRDGVVLVFAHAQSSLQADLDRHRLTDVIGADHILHR